MESEEYIWIWIILNKIKWIDIISFLIFLNVYFFIKEGESYCHILVTELSRRKIKSLEKPMKKKLIILNFNFKIILGQTLKI